MGIGLVDPILKPIGEELHASPSQVSLLFTSYMAVTGCAMLITGAVASRIGPKRTLLGGLALIVIFSALAGSSQTIGEIVGFRAGWGLGNALFIATALATIVGAASGGVASAIILYEAALGRRHRGRAPSRWLPRRDLLARAVLRRRDPDGARLRGHRDLPPEPAASRSAAPACSTRSGHCAIAAC